jgi:hypothetical protein
MDINRISSDQLNRMCDFLFIRTSSFLYTNGVGVKHNGKEPCGIHAIDEKQISSFKRTL